MFGTDSAAAGKSGAKVSGSFEGLGAYTYASPAHWSRAVGRLSLAAQGEFNADVKWKVGGRVDGDLVYATSDFYLDPVKRNQRLTAIWGENYIDVSAGSWDFRVGAQQIIWGEVVGLFFADVVSARDTREFLLPRFDVIRIPQWAARAEYFAGDAHVELVWIPVPTFDRIGKPGADFYPAPLPSPTPASVAALFQDPDRPDRNLGNSNYGVRANTLVSGWDLAAFYYRSFSSQPTFYRQADGHARATVRVSAELRPDLAGGRHRDQGSGRGGPARRGGLCERPGLQRDGSVRSAGRCAARTASITS